MSNVVHLPIRHEQWLTKRQLAAHLGCSTRFLEMRVAEGMPSRMAFGRRQFRLSQVQPWLENNGDIEGEK
jgi:hypothetical protein